MVGCPLMEGTGEVSFTQNRQLVRHPRRHYSFLSSKIGNSSAYVIGIGSNFILRACCRGCCWCWCLGTCWNCNWFCEATSETSRVLSLSNSTWSVVTSSRQGFLVQTDTFSLFVCTSVVGASWLWARTIGTLWDGLTLYVEKTNVWDTDLKIWM